MLVKIQNFFVSGLIIPSDLPVGEKFEDFSEMI
jgi:hypothetical protein